MGTVYLAEHPVIGSRVAVKFLHEAMASRPRRSWTRFYDEARAVNLIGHENIVGIYDLSVAAAEPLLLRDGVPRRRRRSPTRLRAGPVAPPVALDVAPPALRRAAVRATSAASCTAT